MKAQNTNTVTGETLLVTPTGFKQISSIKEGDEIVTDKGVVTVELKSANIGYATSLINAQGRVQASVGVDTVVDGLVYSPKKKTVRVSKINHLKFEKQNVEIDPYFLGLWLADGSSANTMITSHDDDVEIHKFLHRYASNLDQKVTSFKCSPNGTKYSIVGSGNGNFLQGMLREANLTNNKHVPENYIYNDTETRMQLLAGMLDGDGYVTPYSFKLELKDEGLIRDIQKIADSLGFKTNLISQRKMCTNSPTRAVGTYWKLSICGTNIHNIPTKLERKQFSSNSNKRDNSKVVVNYTTPSIELLYRLQLSNPKAKLITSTGIII